jgi:drug/metabolite transporter (DMT)-like permease
MDHLKGVFLVCFAGTLWSFGALIIRYMVEARNYQWQYLFYRGLTIAIVLLIYLMVTEGKTFYLPLYLRVSARERCGKL